LMQRNVDLVHQCKFSALLCFRELQTCVKGREMKADMRVAKDLQKEWICR
jgi:hypothetical protein